MKRGHRFKAGVDKCFQMRYKCIKKINTLGMMIPERSLCDSVRL